MRRVAWCASIIAAVFASGCPLRVVASSGTADVHVHVSFDAGGARGALCRLHNTLLHEQRIADGSGMADFDGVQAGKYGLDCELKGYEPARSEVLVRSGDLDVNVDVRLGLHEIGRVAAHASAITSARLLTRGSPLGKISENLYDLMNSAGGANILTDASGSLVGVSLEGRDPRMTQYGFDGTRVPEPGALRALDADLLQSAQTDDAKSEVDFYTLAPTTFPEYTYRQTLGGFGAQTTQAGVRGSIGSVGFVVQGKVRGQRSALDNATYLDSSGLRYRHAGAFHGDGLLAKISAPLNDNFTFTAETLIRRSTTLPIDAFFAGSLPSGAGPGNTVAFSSSLTKVQLEGEIGRWQTKFNATTIRTNQLFDYSNRVVDCSRCRCRRCTTSGSTSSMRR